MMNKLFIAVTLVAIPATSFAQTATSLTQSNSNSFSRTGSSNAILAPVSGSNFSQPAIAPDLSNITADSCALGNGVSGAGGGIISLGANLTTIDKDCRNQGNAGAWHVLGRDLMAIGSICLDPKQASLYQAVYGTPCPGQPGWKVTPTAMVSQPPTQSPRAAFCASLNPAKVEDKPYIAECLRG
jgi:hypothetical protein